MNRMSCIVSYRSLTRPHIRKKNQPGPESKRVHKGHPALCGIMDTRLSPASFPRTTHRIRPRPGMIDLVLDPGPLPEIVCPAFISPESTSHGKQYANELMSNHGQRVSERVSRGADRRDEAYELSVPQVKDLGEEQVTEWPGSQREKWWCVAVLSSHLD